MRRACTKPQTGTFSHEGYSPQMARFRPLGVVVSTFATGAFLGLVLTALITPVLPGGTLPGNRHEPPETRGWIIARLRGDAQALNRLQLPTNVAGRAARLQQFDTATSLQLHTLTFLGGTRAGQIGQYGYVLTVETPTGGYDSLPLLITTLGDRVWYMRGGAPGRPIPATPAASPGASGGASPSVPPAPSGSG
jgi:hypothetical protein